MAAVTKYRHFFNCKMGKNWLKEQFKKKSGIYVKLLLAM
jgi:hypothetical protein